MSNQEKYDTLISELEECGGRIGGEEIKDLTRQIDELVGFNEIEQEEEVLLMLENVKSVAQKLPIDWRERARKIAKEVVKKEGKGIEKIEDIDDRDEEIRDCIDRYFEMGVKEEYDCLKQIGEDEELDWDYDRNADMEEQILCRAVDMLKSLILQEIKEIKPQWFE